jgi:hypothetical protein
MRTAIAALLATTLLTVTPGALGAQSWLQVGGEQYFRVEWTSGQNRRGAPVVSGYVYNTYAAPAVNVSVLVEALDASGKVVSQSVARVAGDIPGDNRRYFEQRVPAASGYRLRVVAWEFRKGGGGN